MAESDSELVVKVPVVTEEATHAAPSVVVATTPPPSSRWARLGLFIQTYHSFLSSFVIGAAGLIATSIWQYRQSEMTRHQAEAQGKIAEMQAANSWKIERAEILAKNLQVLSSHDANSIEQRYGVLLSLTRGNILDPELAVSYAFELGKESPEYMRSVLAGTTNKDYARLARAYKLSCEEKYGLVRDVAACADDRLAPRSEALAELIGEELTTVQPGPWVLLTDERHVQDEVQSLTALFEPVLIAAYERRQWDTITRFQSYSRGAHLVAALVLAAARTGEFVTSEETQKLDRFHDEQTKWLVDYLGDRRCDPECKGKLLEVMVSHYEESQGDYDAALRRLLESPQAQSGSATTRLHARLLWCQVADGDLFPLRDQVLVPAVADTLAHGQVARDVGDALVGLLALLPEPTAGSPAAAAWQKLIGDLEHGGGHRARIFHERRATAARERQNPPAAMRKIDFCNGALRPARELAPHDPAPHEATPRSSAPRQKGPPPRGRGAAQRRKTQ